LYLQAPEEIKVLRNVQQLVEANYVNGRPRHHLPSARDTKYTPESSVFFIADYKDFLKLSARDIHRIARHRQILVQNVPQEDFSWSRETLARLGGLKQFRDIQGMWFLLLPWLMIIMFLAPVGQSRGDAQTPGLLKVGTLDQLHSAADKRVLLSLSLPLGAGGIVDTPRLRYVYFHISSVITYLTHLASDLSSDRWAWLQTNGAAGFRKSNHPSDDTTWGTAGSRGAVSWIHLDDEGFNTSTQVLTGRKYWVVFSRDPTLPRHDIRGDMGGIGWSPDLEQFMAHDLKGWFKAEAVEMGPGCLL
jgi:hypothetical protein